MPIQYEIRFNLSNCTELSVKLKIKCSHQTRQLKNVCLDCPKRLPNETKWKAQCVHPKRPLNKLCINCPKRILKTFKSSIKCC